MEIIRFANNAYVTPTVWSDLITFIETFITIFLERTVQIVNMQKYALKVNVKRITLKINKMSTLFLFQSFLI